MLTNNRLANHSGGLEHVVGRLKNPLQMRRIALAERQLFTELVERDTPREDAPGASDLDQAVQASRDGGWEREVACHTQLNDVAGLEVLTDDRRDDHARFAGSAATIVGNRAS